jgi:hypothetical protein
VLFTISFQELAYFWQREMQRTMALFEAASRFVHNSSFFLEKK